jgi:alpha-ketoglutarate-dependent 2,4-dichlorophenoxyacetate dioxygenase
MLDLRPLHPLIGVEVRGVDVRRLDAAAFDEIRSCFERHSLLLLRDQELSDEEQVAFARRFGPLERTKVGTVGAGTELVILTNIGPDGAILPETHRQSLNTLANRLWHSDSSFKRVPALASILSGRTVPPIGGETEYVSMRAVWRALPAAMQRRVEGRVAIHDYAWSRGKVHPELMTEAERETLPPVRQVMVRVHPQTGEKALYVGSHACGIEGMSEAEGRALIDELIAFASQPRFVYAHAWRRNDLLVWDNRSTIHRGRPFPVDAGRHLVRATVAGDAPTVAQ